MKERERERGRGEREEGARKKERARDIAREDGERAISRKYIVHQAVAGITH